MEFGGGVIPKHVDRKIFEYLHTCNNEPDTLTYDETKWDPAWMPTHMRLVCKAWQHIYDDGPYPAWDELMLNLKECVAQERDDDWDHVKQAKAVTELRANPPRGTSFMALLDESLDYHERAHRDTIRSVDEFEQEEQEDSSCDEVLPSDDYDFRREAKAKLDEISAYRSRHPKRARE